jgi:superfamily II DNA or RNA helicase
VTFTLRNYQQEALIDIRRRFAAGDTRVPIVMATGLGKTQVFTAFIDEWLEEHPGQRVLGIAHTDELIGQMLKRMRQVSPRRRIGRVQGQQHNDVLAEIIASSRQTLASEKRRAQIKRVGLIVIDECHHAVRSNTYGRILEHFGAFDEGQKHVSVLGVTATLARSDKAKLSSVWQDCTFVRDILFGIRNGYLLDVRGERIIVPDLDMSRVRTSAGDFRESDLADELERTFAPEIIAEKYRELAAGRRGIAFWPLVETAFHGAKAFDDAGIRSAVIHGGTPKPERRELLQRYRLPFSHPEAIETMHNAMVLTEGFDLDPEPGAEPLDVVVVARPTKSAGLYQQCAGRGLRPHLAIAPELRSKALILDVTGAGAHGLRSLIDLSPERALKENPDNPDMSLAELDDWLQEQLDADAEEARAGGSYMFESDEYRGQTATVAFDPLGRDKVWGRTPSGHYYISAGSVGYVFLAPSLAADADPGTYDVVVCSKVNYLGRDGIAPWQRGTEHVGLPLEMALNWGEDIAVQVGGAGTLTLNKRKATWRKAAPTDAQLKLAAARRVPVTREENGVEVALTKGELSEALDDAQAARRIDPLVSRATAVLAQRVASE